ncbi:MAG: alpha/beta hydrolase [Chloroflexi bacterium]|nr:alpha/beta hydrolase [Chloroflexota bacterium]
MTLTNHTPQDKFVEANGLRIHYLDWAGDRGRTVVLIHGLMGIAHDWDEVASQLSRDHRVLCIELRGHGDSQWSTDGYWPHLLAADIHTFVSVLKIAPFALVGHSLGVWAAISYASDHWPDLSHLVLADFAPEIGQEQAQAIRSGTTDRPLGFRNKEEFVRWFQEAYPTRPLSLAQRRATYGLRRNWADKLVWKYDPEVAWITGSAGLKVRPYLWEQCAKIRCSTLVIRGSKSLTLTPEIRDRMLAVLPNGRASELEGAGHYVYEDNPSGFVRLLRDFLAT